MRKIDAKKNVTTLETFPKVKSWQTFHITKLAISEKNELFFLNQDQKCWFKFIKDAEHKKVFCDNGELFFSGGQMYLDGYSQSSYLLKENHPPKLATNILNPKYSNNQGDMFFIHDKTNIVKVSKNGARQDIGKSDLANSSEHVDILDPSCVQAFPIPPQTCPVRGDLDGPADIAEFNSPQRLIVSQNGGVYVSESASKRDGSKSARIRVIDEKLNVSTLPLSFPLGLGDMQIDKNNHLVTTHGNTVIKITLPK